jgi:hypothetical protein
MSALLENALVAQLDRVSDYESEGQGFESLRARQRVSVRKQCTEALFVFRNITFYGQSIIGGLPVCAFYFAYNLSSTIELYKGS